MEFKVMKWRFRRENNMSSFYERYKELERNLRSECDQMVADGELTQEEADFRFFMVRDEILESLSE